jgi:hypothetical protein
VEVNDTVREDTTERGSRTYVSQRNDSIVLAGREKAWKEMDILIQDTVKKQEPVCERPVQRRANLCVVEFRKSTIPQVALKISTPTNLRLIVENESVKVLVLVLSRQPAMHLGVKSIYCPARVCRHGLLVGVINPSVTASAYASAV